MRPVGGSVGESGPPELGSVVTEHPPVGDARVRSAPLRIERQALGAEQFPAPLDLRVLELVGIVAGEALERVDGGRRHVLRLEFLLP